MIVFISAIFEISSMLADTENRRLRRSSTWAIITDDVRWPYFFCQVYVSSETSFLSSRRICRLGPAGRRSAQRRVIELKLFNYKQNQPARTPSTSLAGAEYVGNLMNDAGVLCKQITGSVGFFTKCTRMREHSRLMSNRMNGS